MQVHREVTTLSVPSGFSTSIYHMHTWTTCRLGGVCSDTIPPEVISVQLSTHRQTGLLSERSIMLWASYTYIDCEVISTLSLLEVSMSSVTGKLRANDSC